MAGAGPLQRMIPSMNSSNVTWKQTHQVDAKKQSNENANMSVLHLYNPLHDDSPSAYAILFHQHESCAGTDIATNS